MPAPSYPLDHQPCIPVRTGTRHQQVGLRELFIHAHTIEDLALPIPPAASALLRVLVAITARLTGLDNPDMPLAQWHQLRAHWLTKPAGFPEQSVHAYFDAHVFDLFHPTRPFLQDPALAHQCTRRAGVNALVYGRPQGRNLVWFNHHTDHSPQPLDSDEALWHLLLHHAYGPSGTCSTRTVDTHTSGKTTAGPLRGTLSFHPHGATLYETLLAGLFPFQGASQDTTDACPWEREQPPDPLQPPEEITWPGAQLTGRSRHAVLLIPSPDGTHVQDAYLTWATQQPRLYATDPYHVMHTQPQNPAEHMRTPRKADADRATWRDLDALLLASDETATVHRPLAFTCLNDLPEELRSRLRVQVHGFDQEGQVRNRRWYTSLTPPIWTWAQEHDPAQATRISECTQAAEHLAAHLSTAADQAWRETTRPGTSTPPGRKRPTSRSRWQTRSLAEYWPRAQSAFHTLIHDQRPARGVFAHAAIDALHAATAAALPQYPGAGRALARAQQALATAGAATP
ncbi:type I-E CRISPR-associated protein Cse1/CasA [Streptomyces sp. NPDC004111]|uniref:type I-E CRISPR-associated protein Cse1/CasA n=1 Tax=Streptomyces sp. NPDC004111 TaxID=3364690 RepID=UPI003677C465